MTAAAFSFITEINRNTSACPPPTRVDQCFRGFKNRRELRLAGEAGGAAPSVFSDALARSP